jgi:hypothetical protein
MAGIEPTQPILSTGCTPATAYHQNNYLEDTLVITTILPRTTGAMSVLVYHQNNYLKDTPPGQECYLQTD